MQNQCWPKYMRCRIAENLALLAFARVGVKGQTSEAYIKVKGQNFLLEIFQTFFFIYHLLLSYNKILKHANYEINLMQYFTSVN